MHFCDMCGDLRGDHPSKCTEAGGFHYHYPPLCCEGCQCASYELAHDAPVWGRG